MNDADAGDGAIHFDSRSIPLPATISPQARAHLTLMAAPRPLPSYPPAADKGAWRAYVEGVFVCADRRGQGIGGRMIAWAADAARAHGDCPFLQLTSNKDRLDAHRFYKRLGFQRTSEGFKLLL